MYEVALICCDKKRHEEINSIIYNLAWEENDKVIKEALIGDYNDDGLKCPILNLLSKRRVCTKRFLVRIRVSSTWKNSSFYLKDVEICFFSPMQA